MAELDKKAAKKAEKARKKEEKKNKNMMDDLEEESGASSKVAVFLATLIIILVWIVIFALLIKWDVGGFGSTVMTPLLKNVPYVNRILPRSDEELSTEDEYPYKTLDEAVEYIKELELELAEAQSGNSDYDAYVAELEAQAEKLKEYEANQAAFEEEKEKFYAEVVFSDEAPDIDEYRQYYESIEPDNAEQLYKQVIRQEAVSEEIEDYVKAYSEMKPKAAAAIFDTMTDNLELVADILENMDAESRGNILANMNQDTAAKVTEIMNPIN
ncbi:MAG: MotE family protein [Roseburia sp.]